MKNILIILISCLTIAGCCEGVKWKHNCSREEHRHLQHDHCCYHEGCNNQENLQQEDNGMTMYYYPSSGGVGFSPICPTTGGVGVGF